MGHSSELIVGELHHHRCLEVELVVWPVIVAHDKYSIEHNDAIGAFALTVGVLNLKRTIFFEPKPWGITLPFELGTLTE